MLAGSRPALRTRFGSAAKSRTKVLAGVVESADTPSSEGGGSQPCRFDACLRHQFEVIDDDDGTPETQTNSQLANRELVFVPS